MGALEKGNTALSNLPGFTYLPFAASFDLLCHLVLYAQSPLPILELSFSTYPMTLVFRTVPVERPSTSCRIRSFTLSRCSTKRIQILAPNNSPVQVAVMVKMEVQMLVEIVVEMPVLVVPNCEIVRFLGELSCLIDIHGILVCGRNPGSGSNPQRKFWGGG